MNDTKILLKVIDWLNANIEEQCLAEELRLDSTRLLTMITEFKEKACLEVRAKK